MKREWQMYPEVHDYVEALIEKFPRYFSKVKSHEISCIIGVGGKAPKGGSVLARISLISEKLRVATGSSYKYVMEVYDANWYDLDSRQKAMVVFHELMHIDQDADDPKLVSHNIEDFHPILKTFGIDYLMNDSLPDLLDDDLSEEDYGIKSL